MQHPSPQVAPATSQGRASFQAGKGFTANPYSAETEPYLRDGWVRGWRAAQYECADRAIREAKAYHAIRGDAEIVERLLQRGPAASCAV